MLYPRSPVPLPPNQQLVAPSKWPVVGERAPLDLDGPWTVSSRGAVEREVTWSLEELRGLPQVTRRIDVHCVTRWSRLGVEFTGVPLSTLFDLCRPLPSARFVSFVAHSELGHVTLSQLAFDGTRMRANSRRSGTRKVADLVEARAALAAKFAELQAKAEAQDAADDAEERLVGQANADQLDAATIAKQLAKIQRQMAALDAAMAEVERVKEAGETVLQHIPLTDPQARVTPNKDGGFAPNYTPLATVDVASGMIVGCDVIAMTNEEHHLVPQIKAGMCIRKVGRDSPRRHGGEPRSVSTHKLRTKRWRQDVQD